MHVSPSRQVNSIGEHNGGLLGLCCPTKRTNRSALVSVLTKKHICSAICWFFLCSDVRFETPFDQPTPILSRNAVSNLLYSGQGDQRRSTGGTGGRPPLPPPHPRWPRSSSHGENQQIAEQICFFVNTRTRADLLVRLVGQQSPNRPPLCSPILLTCLEGETCMC